MEEHSLSSNKQEKVVIREKVTLEALKKMEISSNCPNLRTKVSAILRSIDRLLTPNPRKNA